MRSMTRRLLVTEMADWRYRGEVPEEVALAFAERFAPRQPVPWVDIFGRAFAACAGILIFGILIGLFTTLVISVGPWFGVLALAAADIPMLIWGVSLANDPRQELPNVGQFMVFCCIGAFHLAITFAYFLLGGSDYLADLPLLLGGTGLIALVIAYLTGLLSALTLGLIGLSALLACAPGPLGDRFFPVAGFNAALLAALLLTAAGVAHERLLECRRSFRMVGFGYAYVVFGLLALNLLLGGLSLGDGPAMPWAVAIAGQLAVGRLCGDRRFTGFGVVAFGADLLCRLLEWFPDPAVRGALLLLAGLGLFAVSRALPARVRRPAMVAK